VEITLPLAMRETLNDGQHGLSIVSFDPEHGAGRELVRTNTGFTNWVISPDGSKLAVFFNAHQIRFISLDTGAAHDVTVKDWPFGEGDWSANSKSVFIPSVTPKGIPVIIEVDQGGKSRVALQGKLNTEFVAMIQSPDGRYGLLQEVAPAENNAWMVDNF
jgi:hypothetical protein